MNFQEYIELLKTITWILSREFAWRDVKERKEKITRRRRYEWKHRPLSSVRVRRRETRRWITQMFTQRRVERKTNT